MEWLHQLLKIQNQSWFFYHKEYFRQQWKIPGVDRYEIFKQWLLDFPELQEKVRLENFKDSAAGLCDFSFSWILYGTEDYPDCFYAMMDAPLLLTVIGEKPWRSRPGFSVVGSRKPTSDSLKWIQQELGDFVSNEAVNLVSGGAFGVDQAVHALAIRKKIPTVVFLPSGLGDIYPSALNDWVRPILAGGGCLISEYSVQQRMIKGFFHHRNRLIAQMGVATLVIQAAVKSGSLMTGHLAAEAGRPLWVLPGHPLQSAYHGNLKLLQEGATLVTSAYDLSLFFKVEALSLKPDSGYLEQNLLLLN